MTSDFERSNMRPLSPHSHSNDRDREKALPGPATSLTHADIAQALLESPDEGRTLDFSHKNMGDVGESGAEELATIGRDDVRDECTVLRVALGFNRLATLPMAFALLARLRYLNLRANCFTVFPEVLTVMPSLEILDISRNKLKRLPSQPGTLLGLRVFSISKNKLTRLPPYIAKITNLTVFQLDHNPLEWPAKHVLEPLDNAEDASTMLLCIRNVKRWIEDHDPGTSADRVKGQTHIRRPSDELSYRTQVSTSIESDLTSDDSDHNTNSSLRYEGLSPTSQHARSFSIESDVSNYSIVSHESGSSDTSFYREDDPEPAKHPPSLHPSNATPSSTSSTSISPIVSLLPDNTASDTSNHYTFKPQHADKASPSDGDVVLPNQSHGRNASYSVTQKPSPLNTQLSAKKSLPDLRGSVNATATERDRNNSYRPQIPDLPEAKALTTHYGDDVRHIHKSLTPPEDSDDLFTRHDTPGGTSTPPLVPTRVQPSYNLPRGILPSGGVSPHGPAPPMDVERNSYFRRLSTLPPSTISSTMPPSLLAMIDSARGILFAVSQIYQSLRHYTVFAIDEGLSGLLGKVLDPASTYMTHLINALDRFDSVSRRGIPSPSVCRGVLESCRDNVAVFGKVVGVLHLQLKVLAGSDDARYSRSLLLMLYGSMAEIANSWLNMTPHLDAMLPLLSDHRLPPPIASSLKIHTPALPPTSLSTRSGVSPVPESQSSATPIPRISSNTHATNAPNGRSRTTRRHAGSFSTRDVQIGKALPSATEENLSPALPVVQPLRPALRRPMPSSQPPHLHSSSADSPSSKHSHQDSPSPATPSGSSHSPHTLSYPHQDAASSRAINSSSLEVPSDSSKMVDQDLLDTMEAATETARSVWKMMDEVLRNSKETNPELLESLQRCRDITKRLKEKIEAMRSGAVDGDRKAFWEDAHLFVKAVVSVLTILKAYSVSHPFSATLRSNIAKLTQSTQDFAILLQVSSFSPAPTPGPYSPATGSLPPHPGKLSSMGISRSRSAQASQSSSIAKPILGELRDVPWSALPHQTFKITTDP